MDCTYAFYPRRQRTTPRFAAIVQKLYKARICLSISANFCDASNELIYGPFLTRID